MELHIYEYAYNILVEGGGGLTSIFFQGTPDSLATALNENFGGNVLTCQKNILPKIGVIFA